ncbi:hypothetical protein [Cystobacter fuscus]|uniref:hypothetical protein n=1 Tax=Cystobacter fuscus TaxID=43 RepID=UPI002B2B14CD|nr:hypothetical protein F0U63_06260 [Cystobacter fuscus]
MSMHFGARDSCLKACWAGLLLLCSCFRPNSQIFEDLSLIEVALEFPATSQQAAQCSRGNPPECQNYERAVRAKKALLSQGAAALDSSLEIIQHDCKVSLPSRSSPDKTWRRCIGGLAALYFFSSREQDEQLFAFFEKDPVLLRLVAAERDFAWFHNRFHQERWQKLFDTLASSQMNPFAPTTQQIQYRIELLR